ncbi:MAG: hypothetical protein ABIA63_11545, partial [bacterium]
LEINGILIRFFDTPGFGANLKEVDRISVKSSYKIIGKSDIILYVRDCSKSFSSSHDKQIKIPKYCSIINIANKIDLKSSNKFWGSFNDLNEPRIKISAVKGKNIAVIKKEINDIIASRFSHAGPTVINARQKSILDRLLLSVSNAKNNAENGSGIELIAYDLKEALNHLAEIFGRTTDEEVLRRIFTKFCVGK